MQSLPKLSRPKVPVPYPVRQRPMSIPVEGIQHRILVSRLITRLYRAHIPCPQAPSNEVWVAWAPSSPRSAPASSPSEPPGWSSSRLPSSACFPWAPFPFLGVLTTQPASVPWPDRFLPFRFVPLVSIQTPLTLRCAWSPLYPLIYTQPCAYCHVAFLDHRRAFGHCL